jgi:hypothetical protein
LLNTANKMSCAGDSTSTQSSNARHSGSAYSSRSSYASDSTNYASNITSPRDSVSGDVLISLPATETPSKLQCKICGRRTDHTPGQLTSRGAVSRQHKEHENNWKGPEWYTNAVQEIFKGCDQSFNKSTGTPKNLLYALLEAIKGDWFCVPVHVRLAVLDLHDHEELRFLVFYKAGIDIHRLEPVSIQDANAMSDRAKKRREGCRQAILHCLEDVRVSSKLDRQQQYHERAPRSDRPKTRLPRDSMMMARPMQPSGNNLHTVAQGAEHHPGWALSQSGSNMAMAPENDNMEVELSPLSQNVPANEDFATHWQIPSSEPAHSPIFWAAHASEQAPFVTQAGPRQ